MKEKNKNGFTLIEVMVTVAILGILSTIAFSMFTINSIPITMASDNYVLKGQIKLASDRLTTVIREATAIFVHKDIDSVFKEDIFSDYDGSFLEINDAFLKNNPKKTELIAGMEKYKGWNFITLSADGQELRDFIYHKDDTDEDKGYYTLEKILEKKKNPDGLDVIYEIVFDKEANKEQDNPGTDSLEFTIIGKVYDGVKITETIETKYAIKALSSLQVVDRGDYKKAATVIFYRTEERPMGVDTEVAVAMVLDISGSMENNMAGTKKGGTLTSSDPKRIEILKDEAKELVKKLGNLEFANITIIPFNETANSYSEWMNIQANRTDISNRIDRLSAVGGTNVGDGIRRAYYRFDEYNQMEPMINEDGEEMLKKDVPKYMILLMDGVPTFGSVYYYKNKDYDFVLEDINIDEKHWYGASSSSYATPLTTGKYYEYNNKGKPEQKTSKTNKSVGFYAGNGSKSDDLSKGYITEISKKLANIKDSDNKKNIRVFVIGFSSDSNDRKELNFIQGELQKHAKSVSTTEVIDKTGLKKVFYDINHIILEEYWAITGPNE